MLDVHLLVQVIAVQENLKTVVLPVNEYPNYRTLLDLGRVMVSFRSDCREAFVISGC